MTEGGVRRGAAWGTPTTATADHVITASDDELAVIAEHHRGKLFRYVPVGESDVARNLGLAVESDSAHEPAGVELALDLLRAEFDALVSLTAVNAIVIGAMPSRTTWLTRMCRCAVTIDSRVVCNELVTGVVIASGQFVAGADVNPRSHPGDGMIEVYAYALDRSERRGMRTRLASGTHLPHPRITRVPGKTIAVRASHPLPIYADGVGRGRACEVTAAVDPAALRLLL